MSMEYSYTEKRVILGGIIVQHEELIEAVKRKRGWQPSVVAITIAGYQKRIDVLNQVLEDLHRMESLDK